MPNGVPEVHVPNFCMRGTSTSSKAVKIEDCFPEKNPNTKQFDALTWYSPVNAENTMAIGIENVTNVNGYTRSGTVFALAVV